MSRRSVDKRPPYARVSGGQSTSNFSPLPADFTFYIDVYVPTDAKWCSIEYGNSFVGYRSAANYPDLTPCEVGLYLADGSGDPTGSILVGSKQTGVTAPGDGFNPYVSPAIDVSAAAGQRVCICYTVPSGSTIGLQSNVLWGKQSASGASVNPLPGGFSAATSAAATPRLRFYGSRRPRIFVAGHSIPAGYSAGTAVGKGASAWYTVGDANDWIVDVSGIPQATFVQWLHPDSGTTSDQRPYFWVGSNVYGSDVAVIELGANDLIAGATLADLQGYVTALALNLRARGARKVLADTISPGTSWVAMNTVRANYNAWLLATPPANVAGVFDLAATVQDPADHTQLLAAYSADGDHLSAAGMTAVKTPLGAAIAALL